MVKWIEKPGHQKKHPLQKTEITFSCKRKELKKLPASGIPDNKGVESRDKLGCRVPQSAPYDRLLFVPIYISGSNKRGVKYVPTKKTPGMFSNQFLTGNQSPISLMQAVRSRFYFLTKEFPRLARVILTF